MEISFANITFSFSFFKKRKSNYIDGAKKVMELLQNAEVNTKIRPIIVPQ
jgi:hypothetical protein